MYLIYRGLQLSLRIKRKKRLVRAEPELLPVSTSINQYWPKIFTHNQLTGIQSYRLFNLVDDFNREGLAIGGLLFAR